MWRFRDFSVTQILLEINFEESRSEKSAILAHLETQDFDFDEFLQFLKAEIYQSNKCQRAKNGKNSKLISRNFWKTKISFRDNSKNFFREIATHLLIKKA